MELGYAIKYPIHIEPTANKGFIIKIGCAQCVARDVIDLKHNLGEYLDDPGKYEKEYAEKCGGRDSVEEVPQGAGQSQSPRTAGTSENAEVVSR